jgi:transposase
VRASNGERFHVECCAGAPVAHAVGVEEVSDPRVCERATRRRYTAKYKLEVLAEYEAADRAGKGALRREGLYTSLVSEWRKQRDRGALAALIATRGPKPADPTRRENERLAAENARLQAELDTARKVVGVQGELSCPRSRFWSSSHSRARATPTASNRGDRHRDRAADCAGRLRRMGRGTFR